MKKIGVILFTVFILFSCTRKYESSSPKDLIDAKSMENLLVDFYILEASVRNCKNSNQQDSLTLWVDQQMKLILDERKVSFSQFQSSYSYYMGHEKESQIIMENVINRLIEKETKVIIQIQNAKKTDSVKTKIATSDIVNKVISIKK